MAQVNVMILTMVSAIVVLFVQLVSASRPAIYGYDVVAYHFLKLGDIDVRGNPSIKRFLASSPLLPADLQHIHPEPYEFWFASEEHAAMFEADPWRYIPAFGGHCTHGIAGHAPESLNASLLVEGRVAFTCVNTTEWVVHNGKLYMNSCGMYYDFIKSPDEDISAASKAWESWFGAASNIGPINDACFQDGGQWGGDPVGHLLPPHCTIRKSSLELKGMSDFQMFV